MVPKFIPTSTDRQTYHVVARKSTYFDDSARHAGRFWKLQVSLCSQSMELPFLIYVLCSCVADNTLGRSKKYMEVSGRPGPAEFHSAPWSKSHDSYNLTWKVDSYPPLQEVRLLYRKLMVMTLITHTQEVFHDFFSLISQTCR